MILLNRRLFLAGSTALAAASLAPFHAYAETPRTYRALLVACTNYPNLPKKYSLVGPNHDAQLVREYLLNSTPESVKFAPENITVLADGLDPNVATASATHENLLKAFADLAKNANRGDFVYIHLSGHGSQQPQAKEGDEIDGKDEIFLSSDTSLCTDLSKRLPNVLKDDEIRGGLDAIRDKGAFVWIVFDCCNSGTATRAIDDVDEMSRKVDFLDLVDEGIRADAVKAMAAADEASASRGVGEDNERKPAFNIPTNAEAIGDKGGLVAFFAAQSIEETPEMPLPKGEPNATRYGLFTFTIFSKLAENPNASYRQLGQAVLQQYLAYGRTKPTPLFEGSKGDLDAPVFGTEVRERTMQWPIKVNGSNLTVEAGQLQRLTPGTKLAVLRDPRDEMSAAVGYVAVRSSKMLSSVLDPIGYDGKPVIQAADVPPNAYVRLAELVVDFKLAVARPGPSDGLDAETALVNSVLDEVIALPNDRRGFNVALVEPGQSADLRLAVLRKSDLKDAAADASDQPGLWFLPPSGDVTLSGDSQPPPIVIIHTDDRPGLVETVAGHLRTIFRAISLSRLAAAPSEPLEDLTVEFLIKRDGKEKTLEQADVPRVTKGDEMHIYAKNTLPESSKKQFDLNVLYIASNYEITHWGAKRLAPNDVWEEGLFGFDVEAIGMERMIAVFTEATEQKELEDLSYLAQEGVPALTRDISRGPEQQPGFADMLSDIGMAPATRSAKKLGDKGGAKGAVTIYQFETVIPSG